MNFSLGCYQGDTICSSNNFFKRKAIFCGKIWSLESSKYCSNICQTQTVSWSWTTNSENRFQRPTLNAGIFFEATWTADSWVDKGLGIQRRNKQCRPLQTSVCLLTWHSMSHKSNLLSLTQQRINTPHFVFHQWNTQQHVLEAHFPAKAC